MPSYKKVVTDRINFHSYARETKTTVTLIVNKNLFHGEVVGRDYGHTHWN